MSASIYRARLAGAIKGTKEGCLVTGYALEAKRALPILAAMMEALREGDNATLYIDIWKAPENSQFDYDIKVNVVEDD